MRRYRRDQYRAAPLGGLLLLVALIMSGLILLRPNAAQGATQEARPQTTAVSTPTATPKPMGEETAVSPSPSAAAAPAIAPFFTPEVQHWGAEIVAWAAEFDLDPNIVATIMQIESCGDYTAVSPAGARGLFQVMPYHFNAGEDPFHPETNARRGLAYYAARLEQTGGDVNQAFAGYNGGHRAAAARWESWPAETRAYFRWSSGIYGDAQAGRAASETLETWLAAGGRSLCTQAAASLGIQ
jgi:soluble lytic murein transglycosylase-like protein